VRPPIVPPSVAGAAAAKSNPGRLEAQRAFFALAAGSPAPAAPAAPSAPAETPRTSMQSASAEAAQTPQKILRPGSLIDIRI
jgi:hypothetical protein